jgi:DnaJ-domain-containing protein 1
MTARLSRLEQLVDARIHFRVTLKAPRGAVVRAPLPASEFLTGRRRFRDRSETSAPRTRSRPLGSTPLRDQPLSAFRVLGVAPGADTSEIKRAYRQLARTFHPDLHPDASDQERRVLAERFNALTNAYRQLVA